MYLGYNEKNFIRKEYSSRNYFRKMRTAFSKIMVLDEANKSIIGINLFPNNIFEPRKVIVNEKEYTLYLARFSGLYALYNYISSKPKINRQVYSELESISGSGKFAGMSFDKALKSLISDGDLGYEEFLSLQKNINIDHEIKIHQYKTIRTVAGGSLNIPAYSAGNSLCYETTERIVKPRFLRIHVLLSYSSSTTKSQILNRAIIITNILKALENSGYSIDLNAFVASKCSNEIIHIITQLKRQGQSLNMDALYKSLCKVEFLRRIIFRVKETLDVKNDWNWGYGTPCDKNFVSQVLKFDKKDLYFDQPNEMNIEGLNLAKDFEAAINYLGLADKIDVEKTKKEFSNKVKKLKY